MFSLILTIIAVVIVTALALATIYYGGSAFTQGKEAAVAATILNEGTQLQAAITLYETKTGSSLTGTQEEIKASLVTSGALAAFPATGEWSLVDNFAVVTNLSDSQCLAVNKKLGVETIPQCADLPSGSKPLCCNE